MRIKIAEGESQVAGFISWRRLFGEVFPRASEIAPGETVVTVEVSERGLNYFVTTSSSPTQRERE